MRSILVIFGDDLPEKSKKWFRQFDEILTGKDIERFIGSGSVQEAYEIVNKLSRMTLKDGSRLSKSINYEGYELWWVHYDSIYSQFCLPYTQYAGLLSHLKDFENVYLFHPPWPRLFQYFLRAHNRRCVIISRFRFRKLLPFSFGVLLQLLLSLGFLLWLKLARPAIMLRTSDRFNAHYDFDFRQKFIYDELRKGRVPFVEFIRSMEPPAAVLKHAWRRKRPVVYSSAIIECVSSFANCFSRYPPSYTGSNPEERFWFLASAHFLRNVRGTIWSIRAMKLILRWIGIKAAIIPTGGSRSFHEILGCKLAGIKTVGIQHAALPRYFFVSDFTPEFDGKIPLSLDKCGIWSDWWKQYYLQYGRAFKSEQLYVSGHIRPLEKKIADAAPSEGRMKVLFISEQLADPKEIMPYLVSLLSVKDFDLCLKVRPQVDGFIDWLKKNDPGILERVKILSGNVNQAIAMSDVVAGSHSTAVLEALLQLKPFVFFRTKKWGDYFNIKDIQTEGCFFAENPDELIQKIRESVNVPKADLEKLQERFFGDPYQNGSKWVVEQALEFAKNYDKHGK